MDAVTVVVFVWGEFDVLLLLEEFRVVTVGLRVG